MALPEQPSAEPRAPSPDAKELLMASEIVPRRNYLSPNRSGRMPRAAARAVEYERERAAVAVAQVNRVALTAQVALQRAAEISELENRLIQMAPLGEARYRAIADAAAMGLANIVHQQSMDL